MPRTARIVVPGIPHHVTQRGNNRQTVFFVDDDYRAYVRILAEQTKKHGVEILGYCFMTNHVHLVAVPEDEDALAKAVGRTHFVYTQYVNRLHKRSGHLWQNRFHSCAMDDDHYWTALRYVERNPVRAKLTRVPWTYPWSSAAAHVGAGRATRNDSGLLDLDPWRRETHNFDWKEYLSEPEDADEAQTIRRNTRIGRPLGSDRFLSKLETALGRRLRPLPVGRPKKALTKPAQKRKTKKRNQKKAN